jgi:hypothetical protein
MFRKNTLFLLVVGASLGWSLAFGVHSFFERILVP